METMQAETTVARLIPELLIPELVPRPFPDEAEAEEPKGSLIGPYRTIRLLGSGRHGRRLRGETRERL
jgi:hypothetical protein